MSHNHASTPEQRLSELYNLLEKSKGPGLMEDEAKKVVALAYEFKVGLKWERLGLDGSTSQSDKYTKLHKPKAPRWSGETSYDRDMRLAREKQAKETEKKQEKRDEKKARVQELASTQGTLF
jgi:hypothetical protein